MATFIKNFCSECPPTVCEAPVCDGCCPPSITTTKRFLAPGSEPQEGVILLPNTVTVQLANIQIRPCGCTIFDPVYQQVPCTSGLCDEGYCEACGENIASQLTTLYDPKVVEYFSGGGYGDISGYFNYGGYVPALSPNNIFVLGTRDYVGPCNNIYIGNAPPYVCGGYGDYFYSCSLIAETANSLTYAGGLNSRYSTPNMMQGQSGTATITWS